MTKVDQPVFASVSVVLADGRVTLVVGNSAHLDRGAAGVHAAERGSGRLAWRSTGGPRHRDPAPGPNQVADDRGLFRSDASGTVRSPRRRQCSLGFPNSYHPLHRQKRTRYDPLQASLRAVSRVQNAGPPALGAYLRGVRAQPQIRMADRPRSVRRNLDRSRSTGRGRGSSEISRIRHRHVRAKQRARRL